MKILVIEDKKMHRQSAKETLVGHELIMAKSFDKAMAILEKETFEVVLTDMNMPMSKEKLTPKAYKREQVPYGFVIALRAAQCGAKYVAMVTDTNHHHGAMSAALDFLGGHDYSGRKYMSINGAKITFAHAPFMFEVEKDVPCKNCRATGTCSVCKGTGIDKKGNPCLLCRNKSGLCCTCKGTGIQATRIKLDRKDWGKVLADLIAE